MKKYLSGLGRGTRALVLSLVVIFVSAGIAQAATTISTNILTNGTLSATGISTFGATASTTISAAGALVSPNILINGPLNGVGVVKFGATATSTITAAGRIGVGTSTPLDLLHVESATATSTAVVSSGAAAKGGHIILEDSDAGGCTEIWVLNGEMYADAIACPTGI